MTKTFDPEFNADWTVESYVERKPWSMLPPTDGVISCHASVECYKYLSYVVHIKIRTKCYSNQTMLDIYRYSKDVLRLLTNTEQVNSLIAEVGVL